MKKALFVKIALLLLIATTLSGCILVPVDDGYRRGGNRDRGYDEHRRGYYEGR